MSPGEMAALHAAANDRDRAWSEAEFAALLTSPHNVALTGDGALALIRVVADEAELLTLASHPQARRRGRARALLERAHAAAAERGAARIFLEVAADNVAAIALYRSAGYAETGRRRAYYARPGEAAADALLMARPLTSGQGPVSA